MFTEIENNNNNNNNRVSLTNSCVFTDMLLNKIKMYTLTQKNKIQWNHIMVENSSVHYVMELKIALIAQLIDSSSL
jgi:hypothetical protein